MFAQFGRQVKAGQTVAMSGDLLHVGVKFKGEEMDPLEFLAMLYGNIKAMQEAGGDSADGFYDGAPETDYERDREEIERLMFRFLPLYMVTFGWEDTRCRNIRSNRFATSSRPVR